WSSCYSNKLGYFATVVLAIDAGDAVGMGISFETSQDLASLPMILDSLIVYPSDEAVAEPPTERAMPSVAVVTDRLNIRTGPDPDNEVVTLSERGNVFSVVGQYSNCAWLEVALENGGTGWLSGDPKYTRLDGSCSSIPVRGAP
ncbi:MAG: SH3 domain-containing protein, partial [Caldilineaceae bacterium]